MTVRAARMFAAGMLACALATAIVPSAARAATAIPAESHPHATVSIQAQATTPTRVPTPTPAPNGWYWPMNHFIKAKAPGWLAFRTWYSLSNKAWHLAWDDVLTVGRPVYSLGYGRVVISRMNVGGYGPGGGKGGAMVVRYRTASGAYFNALFGHIVINLKKFPVGTLVKPGEVVAKLNAYNPPHLHFGIRKGTSFPKALKSTPKKFRGTVSMLMGHTFEYTRSASGTMKPQTYGFVDPSAWLIARGPWLRIAAAPSKPSAPKRASHTKTFTVSGSFNATRIVEPVKVTIVGERFEGGSWVRRTRWHGSIAKVSGARGRYTARIRVKSTGLWRLTIHVPQNMDWTAGASPASRHIRIY